MDEDGEEPTSVVVESVTAASPGSPVDSAPPSSPVCLVPPFPCVERDASASVLGSVQVAMRFPSVHVAWALHVSPLTHTSPVAQVAPVGLANCAQPAVFAARLHAV